MGRLVNEQMQADDRQSPAVDHLIAGLPTSLIYFIFINYLLFLYLPSTYQEKYFKKKKKEKVDGSFTSRHAEGGTSLTDKSHFQRLEGEKEDTK